MSMPAPFRLRVRFWGVRGSIPAPGPDTSRYGGNTSCLEVGAPGLDASVVFDAGSGIRALGRDLAGRAEPLAAVHLVFTHFHWDHVQGLPFFGPLFRADAQLHCHSACEPTALEHILEAQMRPPFFPVPLDAAPCGRSYSRIPAEGLTIGPLTIAPFPLRHPQPCSGYRIEAGGALVVYATDTEMGDPEYDRVLADHCAGADVLICDAQNTVDEEAARRGWGHSSWRQAAEMAHRAGVRQLVLFHHDPWRTDAAVDEILERAAERFPGVQAAREGAVLTL